MHFCQIKLKLGLLRMLKWFARKVTSIAVCAFALSLPSFVSAQIFKTVDSYVEQLSGKHQVLETKTATANTSAGKRIFGIAFWRLNAANSEQEDTVQASVFVLESTGAGIRELSHSHPFDFNVIIRSLLELAIEASSKDRFNVTVLLQSSGIGSIEYRFVERQNTWYLAGLESSRASRYLEKDDEAIGDTRTEQSTNFLTGRTITKTFSANKLTLIERKKKTFPKLLLERFEIFDPRHEQ